MSENWDWVLFIVMALPTVMIGLLALAMLPLSSRRRAERLDPDVI
jgi:hypothetical protein